MHFDNRELHVKIFHFVYSNTCKNLNADLLVFSRSMYGKKIYKNALKRAVFRELLLLSRPIAVHA